MLAHVGRTDGERDKWGSVKCVVPVARLEIQSGVEHRHWLEEKLFHCAAFFGKRRGRGAGGRPLLAALPGAVRARDGCRLFCRRVNYFNVSTSCTKSGVPERLRVGVFHPCQHDTL